MESEQGYKGKGTDFRPSPYRCIRRVCQRPALHFVTSKEARSGTISTSDANDPMGIIPMLFLFVKQSAFICRTFIKNGSGRGRNGCTKFLPRLSSYSPRCSPMCWIRHWRRTWGNLTKYNVGRWLENNLEEGPDGMHKEKAPDIV